MTRVLPISKGLSAAALIAIVLMPPTAAGAQVRDKVNRVNLLVNAATKSASVDQRKGVASALSSYWHAIGNHIPRLSPKEAEWIKGEEESDDPERILAIIERPEWARYALMRSAERCDKQNRDIIGLAGKSPKDEALIWVQSLHCYRDSDKFLRHDMRAAGLIHGERDEFDLGLQEIGLWQVWIIDVAIKSALSE
jgi:hypothetical protein